MPPPHHQILVIQIVEHHHRIMGVIRRIASSPRITHPEIVDANEIELLQDMLVAGINAAIEQSQTMAAQKMEGLTGGMDINNLLGGLGGL